MASLRETRRKLRWVAGALAALCILALAVLFSPLAGTGAARQQEFEQVRQQVQARLKTVVPPEQVQQRVEDARKQIEEFYEQRLPSAMSDISRQLGDVASRSGVRLLNASYESEEAEIPGLTLVRINASLSGDYLQEVKFINALERHKLFFVVDEVTLGETDSGQVRLSVVLETYLKTGS